MHQLLSDSIAAHKAKSNRPGRRKTDCLNMSEHAWTYVFFPTHLALVQSINSVLSCWHCLEDLFLFDCSCISSHSNRQNIKEKVLSTSARLDWSNSDTWIMACCQSSPYRQLPTQVNFLSNTEKSTQCQSLSWKHSLSKKNDRENYKPPLPSQLK